VVLKAFELVGRKPISISGIRPQWKRTSEEFISLSAARTPSGSITP
jgi:hypothetical protein